MFLITQRYLMLEILKSSSATTLILYVILMSNTLGRILSDISDGKTPTGALIPVLTGQSANVFSLLLPLGFFLGIVFAFGRLYKDHELVVLQACGFGYQELYKVVLILLLPTMLISVYFSLWFSADMKQRAHKIVDEMESKPEIQQIRAGQFNANKSGNQVIFVQQMTEDRTEISDIVISQPNLDQTTLETALKGRNKLDPETGDLFLEVGPGVRYQGKAGDTRYDVIDFARHGILIRKKEQTTRRLEPDQKYFTDILSSDNHYDRVELWWRIAIPITLVVMALLAVPLSYISPRQGRYGKIGLSLLIFIVYLNLLGLTRSSLEDKSIPLWINFWWVHALFIVMTVILLRKRTRFKAGRLPGVDS